jgi:formiminoglutamase
MTGPASREWLAVHHGDAPLVVSFPHTGIEIPESIEPHLVSAWLARKDTDFWVDVLYDCAHELGATTIRTALSRTVIDVNRDPSGASLYPGQTTTGLCPLETFDGEPLYKSGNEPGPAEILRRRAEYFDPFHSALAFELERKRAAFGCVVLYDAHAIRSVCCRNSTSAPTTAPPAIRRLPWRSKRSAMPRASRASPTAGFAAAGSRDVAEIRR